MCPVWRANRPYRKRFLKRFPHVVFFGIDAGTVDIIAVAHAKRHARIHDTGAFRGNVGSG